MYLAVDILWASKVINEIIILKVTMAKETAGDPQQPRKRQKFTTLAERLKKIVYDFYNRDIEEFVKGIDCNIEFV